MDPIIVTSTVSTVANAAPDIVLRTRRAMCAIVVPEESKIENKTNNNHRSNHETYRGM